MAGLSLALIDGGRWGRTHAGVLAQLSGRIERILWVSRHNRSSVDHVVARRSATSPRFELFFDLDAALAERPAAAIVVNAAADHEATVEALLYHDVPSLVEKPLALNAAGAKALVELAERRKVLFCLALHLLKADFLQHFRQLCTGRQITKIEIEWLDPDFEIRHGEVKSSNLTTHKADEVVPHLWSLLRVLQNTDETGEFNLRRVTPQSKGAVKLEIDAGSSRATILFGRRAVARKRSVELIFDDGGSAELDFTEEPGRIAIDGLEFPNIEASKRVGPLAAEIREFLDVIEGRKDATLSPQLASRCIGSVLLAETVRERLIESEAHAVASRLANGGSIRDDDISAWLIDNITPLIYEGGISEVADCDLLPKLIQVFQQAVDEETHCTLTPSGASSQAVSLIRKSRFFACLMKHQSIRF